MCKITICIVNYNTADFVINTLNILPRITYNNYKVIIRDNNSKIEDYIKLENALKNFTNVELFRVEDFNYKGSMAHGLGLNDLFKRVKSEYSVIIEADFTFLHKNWDKILISELNDDTPSIGTEVDEVTPSSVKGKKFHDFPIVIGILIKTDIIKSLDIDFKPKEQNEYQDTGFEMRGKFLKNNLKAKIIESRSTRNYKEGPFKNILCTEYYLNEYEKIFASHFCRGSTLGLNKYKSGITIYLVYLPFLGKLIGSREKKIWISICDKLTANID